MHKKDRVAPSLVLLPLRTGRNSRVIVGLQSASEVCWLRGSAHTVVQRCVA